jgi:small subunit ribosomal protein S20
MDKGKCCSSDLYAVLMGKHSANPSATKGGTARVALTLPYPVAILAAIKGGDYTMANRHPSAMKRARQNVRRNERNSTLRSALRTTVKKVVVAVGQQDVAAAAATLPEAIRALGKATSKGIVHKNYASRKISRLTRKVAALSATEA